MLIPFTYRSRKPMQGTIGYYFNRAVFSEDYGPFKKGVLIDRLEINYNRGRIISYKKGKDYTPIFREYDILDSLKFDITIYLSNIQ